LSEGLAARRKNADAGSIAALDRFGERLADISGSRPTPNHFNGWSFPPQSTQTLAFVQASLGDLMAATDGADADPSADAQAGYTKLAALTDATLKAWDGFKQNDLATLNKTLRTAHIEPLSTKPAK
jgi:hypothetical protein